MFAPDNYIYCYGSHSCSNSNITSAMIVYLDGYVATQNAILQLVGDSSVQFFFRGYNSGYNATIICHYYCNIYCYSAACNNLKVKCVNGSTSCIYNYHCGSRGTQQSDFCINGDDDVSQFKLYYTLLSDFINEENDFNYNYNNFIGSTFENSAQLCDLITDPDCGDK